jgi:hypothetical protein
MPENAKNSWIPLVAPVATLFRKASVCSHNRPSRGRRGVGLAIQVYSTPVLPTAWSMPSQSSRFFGSGRSLGRPSELITQLTLDCPTFKQVADICQCRLPGANCESNNLDHAECSSLKRPCL